MQGLGWQGSWLKGLAVQSVEAKSLRQEGAQGGAKTQGASGVTRGWRGEASGLCSHAYLSELSGVRKTGGKGDCGFRFPSCELNKRHLPEEALSFCG